MGEEHFEGGTLYVSSPGANGDLDWTPVGTFSELDISTGIDGDNNHEPDQPYAHFLRDKEAEFTASAEFKVIEKYERIFPEEDKNG